MYQQGNLIFKWDLIQDKANLTLNNKSIAWKRSLLPSFWIQDDKIKRYVKVTIDINSSNISEDKIFLNTTHKKNKKH